MRQGRGVADILKLPDHLLVGQNLSGIGATQNKQAAQERGLVDARQLQHVARQRRSMISAAAPG